ncbi:small ribosomal subunit Rsm22 family protein [Bdellovibrionota bacterium FG-1]
MIKIKPASVITPPPIFPPAWLWLVDEAIPAFVKKQYSPRESWKNKPFSKEDAHFFFKGIEELSELFTEERPRHLPAYFRHPKFRSSYLLYFLPLQAAKFLTIFHLHPKAIQAALEHGRKTGVLRVADLGAGPGTASIALLLTLLNTKLATGETLPPIEMDWLDTNGTILEDGKALAEQISSQFPKLRDRVTIRIHTAPWWEASRYLSKPTSLILLGHVLNEAAGPVFSRTTSASYEEGEPHKQQASEKWLNLWGSLLREKAQGGGVLFAEPAAKRPSQFLSSLRDQLFSTDVVTASPTSIWGPCLHAGHCPLAGGRDWCHFSVPANIPGNWFRDFSKALSSERQWVKFSYLWLATPDYPAPQPEASLKRVISDPMAADRGGRDSGPKAVLICEPEHPGRHPLRPSEQLWRGDLVKVRGSR